MVARYLVCLVLFGLLGCSNETVITTRTEAQSKPTSNNSISPLVEPKVESPVKVVGDFENVKSNGEHQWGYSVQIWKQGDKIYGLISGDSDSRLIGDPPTGVLENVYFDPKTSKLSFRAKLSLGQFMGGESSRDVYEFKGILTKQKLAGNLLVTNELCSDKCPQSKKITLRRSKEWSSEMGEFQSYKDWKSFADEILEFRGPKW